MDLPIQVGVQVFLRGGNVPQLCEGKGLRKLNLILTTK